MSSGEMLSAERRAEIRALVSWVEYTAVEWAKLQGTGKGRAPEAQKSNAAFDAVVALIEAQDARIAELDAEVESKLRNAAFGLAAMQASLDEARARVAELVALQSWRTDRPPMADYGWSVPVVAALSDGRVMGEVFFNEDGFWYDGELDEECRIDVVAWQRYPVFAVANGAVTA